MKKLTALIMAAILMFTLAACSDSEKETPTDAGNPSQTETTLQQETTRPAEDKNESDFKETVAIDNESCRLTVKSIKESYTNGTYLELEAENLTEDTSLVFTVDDLSVNGVKVFASYYSEVAPGKKTTDSLVFDNDILAENNITSFTDFELSLRVYDAEDWFSDDIALEKVNIYPYGEDKAESFTRTPLATDIKVLDTDEVSVYVIGWGEDSFYDYALDLYIENKSATTDYMYSVSSCSVNGVEITSMNAYDIPAGKVSFEQLGILDGTLEEIGIEKFTDICFTMSVFDSDSWEPETVAENEIHVYPFGKDQAKTYERAATDKDTVVVDNEKFTVIITGLKDDPVFDEQDLYFYIVNKTDESLSFSMQDVSVNDYMLDPLFATTVSPGMIRIEEATWYDEDIEGEITKIEFTMVISSSEDWLADPYLEQTVTYNP